MASPPPASSRASRSSKNRGNAKRESQERAQSYTHDCVYTNVAASSDDASQRVQYYEARATQAMKEFEQKFNGEGGKR